MTLLSALSLFAEANHTIRPGETIYSLARKYRTTPEAIITLNQIEDHTNIAVGVKLIIPQNHKVQKGETYYSIAKRYGISVPELLTLNSRTATQILKRGEQLLIPVGANPTAAAVQNELAIQNNTTNANRSVPVSTRVASTAADNFWPHDGKRGEIKGKFPAVTFDAQSGDAVRAVYRGRVIYIGNNPHFGRVVFIQAPSGHIYIYGGHDSVEVQVGSLVSVGSVVGRVGRPGAHLESPRIYFSVWHRNRFIDPQQAPRG